jgi:hypothetical protein
MWPRHNKHGTKTTAQKWLLKDRPTHAALEFQNQTTAETTLAMVVRNVVLLHWQ